MKPKSLIHLVVLFFALISSLMFVNSSRAQLTLIPTTSYATNGFFDHNSVNPSYSGTPQYGADYYLQFGIYNMDPWNGFAFTSSTQDPTTQDQAIDTITASLSGTAPILTFTGVSLTQQSGNTGYAILEIIFRVDYSVGSSGFNILSPNALCPTFSVNGTIQPYNGVNVGYANVQGYVYFSDNGVLFDQENYNYYDSNLGSSQITFNGSVSPDPNSGFPNYGASPSYPLAAGHTLTVYGDLEVKVDPASISLGTVNPTPIDLVGSQISAGGNFQFQFSGASNVSYSVWASSDLKSWTVIGSGTFGITPATFTDTRTPGQSAQFYRVSTP